MIIILADMGKLGIFDLVYRIPYADKVGHFVLYGILIFLINLTLLRSLPSATNRKGAVIMSGLILALVIGLEELSQRNFPTRTSSWSDLTASYLGVIFFSWLAIKIKR